MCWPFAKALPCAVGLGSQHNEHNLLADSVARLIGHPIFSTLMKAKVQCRVADAPTKTLISTERFIGSEPRIVGPYSLRNAACSGSFCQPCRILGSNQWGCIVVADPVDVNRSLQVRSRRLFLGPFSRSPPVEISLITKNTQPFTDNSEWESDGRSTLEVHRRLCLLHVARTGHFRERDRGLSPSLGEHPRQEVLFTQTVEGMVMDALGIDRKHWMGMRRPQRGD
jgi:hypothetical protein